MEGFALKVILLMRHHIPHFEFIGVFGYGATFHCFFHCFFHRFSLFFTVFSSFFTVFHCFFIVFHCGLLWFSPVFTVLDRHRVGPRACPHQPVVRFSTVFLLFSTVSLLFSTVFYCFSIGFQTLFWLTWVNQAPHVLQITYIGLWMQAAPALTPRPRYKVRAVCHRDGRRRAPL